jgi:hypothetical protein
MLSIEGLTSEIFVVSKDGCLLTEQSVSKLFESRNDGQQFLFCCCAILLALFIFREQNAMGFPFWDVTAPI